MSKHLSVFKTDGNCSNYLKPFKTDSKRFKTDENQFRYSSTRRVGNILKVSCVHKIFEKSRKNFKNIKENTTWHCSQPSKPSNPFDPAHPHTNIPNVKNYLNLFGMIRKLGKVLFVSNSFNFTDSGFPNDRNIEKVGNISQIWLKYKKKVLFSENDWFLKNAKTFSKTAKNIGKLPGEIGVLKPLILSLICGNCKNYFLTLLN